MTTPKEAPAVVTREHRVLAMRLVAPWWSPADRVGWLDKGHPPAVGEEHFERVAQAIADAEARGRAQPSVLDEQVEADLKRLTYTLRVAPLPVESHRLAKEALARIAAVLKDRGKR